MSIVKDEKYTTPDDFWDIESLIPTKKRSVCTHANPNRIDEHIEAVEIEFENPTINNVAADNVSADVNINDNISVHSHTTITSSATLSITYVPNHPLIKEVRIFPWRNNFHFYERFCDMAEHYFDHKANACDSVPFFSYMPQYDQMNRAQLKWYFYWRDCVRAGQYPPTDYSYIFLYVFEIINLPNRIPPSKGQILLCEIWKHYRQVYPLLNRYLADWICDYSLMHQLPPPGQYLSEFLPVIAEYSSFKEFYACPNGTNEGQDAAIYLTFCTNYNYKKSKLYISGELQAKTMDQMIPGAISYVVQALQGDQSIFARTNMQKTTLNRDSFVGALCSANAKRRIEVEYCAFHRSHELRFLITDIITYTENRIRAHFGMKSRLSLYALPNKIKEILDDYFVKVLPQKSRTIEFIRPEYEALYDLPKSDLSFSKAKEIELSSWQITKQLVEAFEQEAVPEVTCLPNQPQEYKPVVSSDLAQALEEYADILCAIDQEDFAKQKEIARHKGKLPDTLVEEINIISTEIIGDILISDGEDTYEIIEDYRQEIQSILRKSN